jgi:hypothetical protein
MVNRKGNYNTELRSGNDNNLKGISLWRTRGRKEELEGLENRGGSMRKRQQPLLLRMALTKHGTSLPPTTASTENSQLLAQMTTTPKPKLRMHRVRQQPTNHSLLERG